MVTPVTLEGRAARLEPLSLAHVPALVKAASGSRETYAWTLVPADEPSMREYVETALREQQNGRELPFATLERATGRVVGSTRFGNVEFWAWPPDSPNQRGVALPDTVEIGWTWLASDVQRSVINTEAKLLMLTHAFETWRVHRVSLVTDARNTRSRDAILRIGARFDGVLRAARIGADGSVRDSACYSIRDFEWPEVRADLAARLR